MDEVELTILMPIDAAGVVTRDAEAVIDKMVNQDDNKATKIVESVKDLFYPKNTQAMFARYHIKALKDDIAALGGALAVLATSGNLITYEIRRIRDII